MVQYFSDIYRSLSSVIQGMGVTIKHLVRKPVTLQYPDERWVLPERFRGFVHNNVLRCNACLGCAKACPVSCIYIETDGKGKDRYMTRWAVDFNKCIWCGLCTEPCPTEAVTMSHDYDHSLYFRRSLVYEFVPPDQPVPCHKEKRLEMGYYVEEKPKPAEKSAPADNAAAPKPVAPKPKAQPSADSVAPPAPAAETVEAAQPAGNPSKSPAALSRSTDAGENASLETGPPTTSPRTSNAESAGEPADESPSRVESSQTSRPAEDDKGASP